MAIKFAELITYFIGFSLILVVLLSAELKSQLPQKKVLGFPIKQIGYPFMIYFAVMILWGLIK